MLDPVADITVTKSAGMETVAVGEELIYAISASNKASIALGTDAIPYAFSPAENVVATESLPLGVIFLGVSGANCSGGPAVGGRVTDTNRTITCQLGTIAPDVTRSFEVRVMPGLEHLDAVPPQIVNDVAVVTSTPERDGTDNTDQVTTAIEDARLDLLVNKSDSPDPVTVGDDVTYTMTVTNNGPSAATDVVLTDIMPSDEQNRFTYVSHSVREEDAICTEPAVGSSGGTLACTFPLLRAGETREVKLVALAHVKGTSTMRELIGRDDGVIVAGTRYRYSDRFSTFAENRWDLYGSRRSLAESYGVTYTPGERWTITGGMEIGTVRDDSGDFERKAVSLGLGYSDNDLVRGRARLEYRTEEGEGLTRDRDTWAVALGYEYKVNDDWRLLFNLDSLFSDSAKDSYRDGEYLEFGLGYAYRPVLNDRLNMLLKYSYLHDLPGEDQVTASGSDKGPMQKSHVFSVDANYDVTPKLTIGGKYGYRRSKVADRGTEDFTTSSAELAILRLDWHVVHMWDILAEGRIMRTRELKINETGALLGVYRHVGNNAKFGVGYEWGKVSDDLTDLDYLGDGLFLNLVAKF